ncbi:MAG: cytochrome C, partial [Gammaproteobacteria bacterium]|nr:cytochrome C [Gammaproteobacteria bacterium]
MSARTIRGLCPHLAVALVLAAALLAAAPRASAVPSFARQTGMACEACHTVYPELTHFGRVFKANGYILSNVKQVRDVTGKKEELLSLAQTVPLSIMAQVSYTQMKTGVPDLSSAGAPGVAQNGTAGFPQQLSLFYAGKIAPNFGAFIQLTYSNSSGTIGIDNTDLRFADTMVIGDATPFTYGLSLNNNPTVQDLWNTTPGWGYPYSGTNAAVSPLANPQINGTYSGSVAGLTAYLYWNESLYLEAGGYRSAKQGTTNSLTGGAGPLDGTASNVLSGLAPYWRVAYEHNWGRNSLEAGLYGAQFRLYPGAGAPLSGPQNKFNDVAEDLQYQFVSDEHQLTIAGTHIHES